MKLRDAGTIDCFDLAFQYQVMKMYLKKEWTETFANLKYYISV